MMSDQSPPPPVSTAEASPRSNSQEVSEVSPPAVNDDVQSQVMEVDDDDLILKESISTGDFTYLSFCHYTI